MSRKEKFDYEYKLEPNHFSVFNTRVCESDISEIKRSEKFLIGRLISCAIEWLQKVWRKKFTIIINKWPPKKKIKESETYAEMQKRNAEIQEIELEAKENEISKLNNTIQETNKENKDLRE